MKTQTHTSIDLISKALLCLSAALLSCGCVKDGKVGANLCPGDTLPAWVSEHINTTDTSLVVFFNPSCPDCVEEMPILEKVASLHPDIPILAVGRDLHRLEILEYATLTGYPFIFLDDQFRERYNTFATVTIPRCYLNYRGIIRSVWTDSPVMSLESFETELDKI